MNSSFPKEWKLVSFGDITTFHKQGYYTKETYSTKGVRLARITDLHGRNVLYGNMPYIEIDDSTYEQFKVEEDDFLIARSGSIGRYGIAKNIPERTVFASYLIKFQFDRKKVDLDLIGYIFQYTLLNQLEIITQGSSNININAENIKTLQFYLPTEKEQKKIAEILTSVDKAIELTEIEIEKLKNLKKGMMQDLLTKGIGHTKFKDSPIGKIPESWEVRELNDLGEIVRGLTYSPDNVVSKGTLVLRSSNVQDGRITFDDNVYVNLEVDHQYLSRPGDILICVRNGSQALIGKSAMISEKVPLATHGAFMTVFRGERNHFVNYLIQSDLFFKYVGLDIGATINSINTGNLKKYKFAIPPIEEQDQIAKYLRIVDIKIDNQKAKFTKYQALKKGLMQDLLTGKVRVKV